MCRACRDGGRRFPSRLETAACSHQPGDVVAMAAGDGGGDGGQAAPLLTEPPSGGVMPLASERNSVSQSTWQVLIGCFACMAAIGILSLKPPSWTCFQKASYFHLVRLLHQAAFQFLQRAGFHAVRSTWNNPFQLAFYLFMEPGLHPTPAGHKGASQLPRTGCGEHCRSGRDGITQGCAHARLLYFRNDLGAAYCSAQLQVGVGHQAPRAPAVGSPKWAESRFIWRGGRKPTHVTSTAGHQLRNAAQLRACLRVATGSKVA